jgi:hypothetical protein
MKVARGRGGAETLKSAGAPNILYRNFEQKLKSDRGRGGTRPFRRGPGRGSVRACLNVQGATYYMLQSGFSWGIEGFWRRGGRAQGATCYKLGYMVAGLQRYIGGGAASFARSFGGRAKVPRCRASMSKVLHATCYKVGFLGEFDDFGVAAGAPKVLHATNWVTWLQGYNVTSGAGGKG